MEPWMNLLQVRFWFARLKGMEPDQKVGTPYINMAIQKGLPFHRDPVTGLRYWLESELMEFVDSSQKRSRNAPLRQRPGRRVSCSIS